MKNAQMNKKGMYNAVVLYQDFLMKRNKTSGIFLIFTLILCLSFMFGCSAQKSSIDVSPNNNADKKTEFGITEETQTPAKSGTSTSAAQTNNSLTDRKVIFTASLVVETTTYDKSIETLETMIEDFSGYIQDSNVETSTSYQSSSKLRVATYSIRIPSGKLKEFLSKTGNIGNIILNSSKGEDVTDQFFDTKAHLDTLTIQEERLLELLKKATTLKDILDLEDRISQVRYEIEQLTGSLNKLTSLIDLSTVTIKITEVETITAPEPEGFWAQVSATFSSSIKALVSTLKVVSLVLVAVLPFIVVILFIFLIVYLIYRGATRKQRMAAKARKESLPEENNQHK